MQKNFKKGLIIFLKLALLIEKRSPSLIKVKKVCFIEFKICVVAGNGSRVVITHQISYCI